MRKYLLPLLLVEACSSFRCEATQTLPDFCELELLSFLDRKTLLPTDTLEVVRAATATEGSRLNELSRQAVDELDCFQTGSHLSSEAIAYLLTTIQGSLRTVICDIWKTCCTETDPLTVAEDPFTGNQLSFFAMACRKWPAEICILSLLILC